MAAAALLHTTLPTLSSFLRTAHDNLFDAVRLELEAAHDNCEEDRRSLPEQAARYEAQLAVLDRLRHAIRQLATADRPEQGTLYVNTYQGRAARNATVVARTPEGMGVLAPPETYRPLSLPDKKLRSLLCKQDNPAAVVEEARQALRDGFPATALKLGKELWPLGGKRKTQYAYELLDAAYAALGREVLRQVLRTHRGHRDLPSVDIFDAESETGNGEA